ncbi:4-(cytidine 5'-diphospho)-2-C-methyl-D-erythritol kinase [Pseudanabaena sp. FACHB-2040]|uniref:4-(cytidine 5'-diphospho)-2-C-methyl-D-erythritol kinase n=1 Tax=Pseudanabaena sp. FACHB-2040 TaxID=2692859 RepID=UPI0016877EC8|nr:4-(cytidine 5'-diphospho)-2-C-methyl-D-erythritol kinase [Pseudanabaena sp. FACHB-2040]MBD2258911.1 4-(cytidine 5'-diphospho)-2-C-methyl-D-erythritol kinase [Pseudanabaena sp. FACHB-2040]
MRFYSLLAAAKINLYLEIIGARPDGFHELVMVMQSISLSDRVTVRSIGVDQIRLRCDNPLVPTDKTNLAYRAAALLVERFPAAMTRFGGVEITLEKRIPVGAGLAGGSSNAAAVLVGLDLLWELGLTQGELQVLGAELGSDVPFSILGGTAIATGRGEQLDPLSGVDELHVVLAKYEDLAVSTPWAYQTYRSQFDSSYLSDEAGFALRRAEVRSGAMVSALTQKDRAGIGRALCNDFEKVVFEAHPQVAQLRDVMTEAGGLGTLMSGSGPTVFTLATSAAEAEAIQKQVCDRIADPNLKTWTARCTASGVRLDTSSKLS